MTKKKSIFVFGSNLQGRHGAGAALTARRSFGAVYGQGVGRQGDSYAIPTKRTPYESLPMAEVERHVEDFIRYASEHPDVVFEVSKIGCGLAGFTEDRIAPLFADAPENCRLPDGWRKRCKPDAVTSGLRKI